MTINAGKLIRESIMNEDGGAVDDLVQKALEMFNGTLDDQGRIDVDGNIGYVSDDRKLSSFVIDGRLVVRFGKVSGDFICNGLGLISLEGCPYEVGGLFDCSFNPITSYVGSPQKVRYFWCGTNRAPTLEGCSQEVTDGFGCERGMITSLKGAPRVIPGRFICYANRLTSMEGGPEEVGGRVDVHYNRKMTSLKGAPKKVGRGFDCHGCALTSLEGAPSEMGTFSTNGEWGFRPQGLVFDCSYNRLTSLKGAPRKVGYDFDCSHNQLTSLDGAPIKVGGNFKSNGNDVKFSSREVRAVCEVGGRTIG